MVAVAALAVLFGTVTLILFAGYSFGRAEAAAEYQPIIEQQQDTIDALLTPRVTLR